MRWWQQSWLKFWVFLIVMVALFLMFGSVRALYAKPIVVGDSIAFGLGHAMHAPTYARPGAGSCEIARYAFPRASVIVVSAGINDAPGRCLVALYARFHGARVLVVLPKGINSARANVSRLAALRGWETIGYIAPRRGYHPRSYPEFAGAVWDRLRSHK